MPRLAKNKPAWEVGLQGAVKEGLNRVDIKNLAMGVYLIRLQGEVRQIVIR